MQKICVKNWGFCYPNSQTPVLSNVCFSVEPGAFVLLCGDSGSGKSTLLCHMKREMAPCGTQTGQIEIDGTILSEMADRQSAQKIGYVGQTPQTQIVTDTVWHELAFGLENLGQSRQTMRRRVAEIAHFFGIEAWFRQKTDTLSGGQKQLLNLASALVMQPEILVLDEPMAQLDPVAAGQFLQALLRVNRELGITIFLCEHNLEQVLPICSQVLYLNNGTLAFDGPPQAFLQAMATEQAEFCCALPVASRLAMALKKSAPFAVTVQQGRALVKENRNKLHAKSKETAERSEEKPLLQAKGLWFGYETGQAFVLRDWSLSLYPGQIHALVGGNGCGKSTALAVLSGGLSPQRGKIKRAVQTVLLLQDTRAMFGYDSIEKELRHTAEAFGQQAQWDTVLSAMRLTELLGCHPYDVSVGERQRAALAKCLLTGAKVLLLDEPTKGMDARAKQQTAQLLHACKQMGRSVFLVSHDLEFAAGIADLCSMMFDGCVIATEEGKAFFTGNPFYTTALHRMTQGLVENCVVWEDLCIEP